MAQRIGLAAWLLVLAGIFILLLLVVLLALAGIFGGALALGIGLLGALLGFFIVGIFLCLCFSGGFIRERFFDDGVLKRVQSRESNIT